MPTQKVIDTLQNEHELLGYMRRRIQEYPNQNFTGPARFIQKSWEQFFEKRQLTNTALNGKLAAALKEDLLLERAQIKKYLDATDDTGYSEQWKTFFECERSILEHLINLCDDKAL